MGYIKKFNEFISVNEATVADTGNEVINKEKEGIENKQNNIGEKNKFISVLKTHRKELNKYFEDFIKGIIDDYDLRKNLENENQCMDGIKIGGYDIEIDMVFFTGKNDDDPYEGELEIQELTVTGTPIDGEFDDFVTIDAFTEKLFDGDSFRTIEY